MNNSPLKILAVLFNKQWWWATLLVVIGVMIMGRLGIWQLDRLEQRRARNIELTEQLSASPFQLTPNTFDQDLTTLKNRLVTAEGHFDFSNQIVLKVQNWDSLRNSKSFVASMQSTGVDLITPYVIEGSNTAILVNRGWIPAAEATTGDLSRFNQLDETDVITGRIQLTQALKPEKATAAAEKAIDALPKQEWYRIDVEAIEQQMPYQLLAVYILQLPSTEAQTSFPYKRELHFDLSEGSHMGYAMQWFTFALIFGGGYLYVVNKNLSVN